MNIRILVVDDESDVEMLFRQQFRRELRQKRYSMDFVLSAQEALAFMNREPDAQDLILILSDINMPGMSGLELLPQIKAARPALPVIMITAYGDVDTRQRALEAGVQGLLTKPIDFDALKDEIENRVSVWEQGA